MVVGIVYRNDKALLLLLKFADLLEQNTVELSVMESLDSGKPVNECQLTDIPETIHTIRWHAELIDKIYDSAAPVSSGSFIVGSP